MSRLTFLRAAALAAAGMMAAPVAAQDFLSGPLQWQQDYLTSVVSSTVLDNLEEEHGQQGRTAQDAIEALAFTPSAERRERNFADFVEQVRTRTPAEADTLQQALSQDIIGRMGLMLAPLGFDMNNLADAYTFWWLNTWDAANDVARSSFPVRQVAGVKAQAAAALAGHARLQQASDADKQQMAEIYWVQGLIINGSASAAVSDADRQQTAALARRNAAGAGLDLDAMTLTEAGFVGR